MGLICCNWKFIFTKQEDIQELEKLYDLEYCAQFARRTLADFLQGLADRAFTGTQIMAELVRLGMLEIKLTKMQSGRGIYHKKTGILTDVFDNHILHEDSDNFTWAAYSKNAESVTFLYSWEKLDAEEISNSIRQFDTEWERKDICFDLSQEFLQQVLTERDRRHQAKQPVIESINPDEIPPGETTTVEFTGKNLDLVEEIAVVDDDLVQVTITSQQPGRMIGEVKVDAQHPPTNSLP